jgi:hypothetical protein
MDGLTFTSKMVEELVKLLQALAWPSVAVWAIYAFRTEIVSLVPYIRKVKAGGIEAEFAERTKVLREEVKEIEQVEPPVVLPTDQPALPPHADQNEIAGQPLPYDEVYHSFGFQVVSDRPAVGILSAWSDVETGLLLATRDRLQQPSSGFPSNGPWLDQALASGVIRSDLATIIRQLRSLRNEVAHATGFEPSREAVKDYRVTAAYVLKALKKQSKTWLPDLGRTEG